MKISLAKSAGFCFGVNNAVSGLDRVIEENPGKNIYTVGAIIHNPQVVERYRQAGVNICEDVRLLGTNDVAVIRAHGITIQDKRFLEVKGIKYYDFTCPYVRKIQKIAAEESEAGSTLILAGDSKHPEVRGIASSADKVHIISGVEDVEKLLDEHPELAGQRVAAAVQTTFQREEWQKIVLFLEKYFHFIRIYDTICGATRKRQEETAALADKNDIMVIIGGRNSSNTQKLYSISKKRCDKTFLVEIPGELPEKELKYARKAGVTAGASTPDDIIREVVEFMSTFNEENFNDISFEEGLESTLISVSNGDRVNALVVAVTPSEIQFDVGTKHAGYMTASEFSVDSIPDLRDVVKVGDEMEAQVIRVNDVDGIIMLSKKRIDMDKFKKELDEAKESGAILHGKVKEVIENAGVIVNYKGQTVFIPAAHSGVARDGDLNVLAGKEVDFKVINITYVRRRKKVVGSIRLANKEKRSEAIERVFSEIEVGKTYEGTVKSLTSFGAFVDIGGVDGLVHISELSWLKIKHPSEVVKVGDTISVYVKSFDPETHKISLGHKRPEDNIFLKFIAEHQVGDTVEVKIVKIMQYGAFAEIIPGVDGYIHISQIDYKRVNKVTDYFKVGDTVEAKIIEINNEKSRVSLSVKALMDPAGENSGNSETAAE